MALDYHAITRSEMARFVTVLRDTDPSARVPSCPEWTAHDLLDHMTGVALFWSTIVRDRLTDPAAAEAAEETRPSDDEGLLRTIEATTEQLVADLEQTPDDVPVFTWSDDKTVGFIRRRMAHEALIHRLDAELAADAVTDIEPELAADGVLEILQHFHGGHPEWSTYAADGPVGLIRATDAASDWLVRIGYFSGLSPNTGKTYDREPTLELVESGEPTYTVTGSAAELNAWLWGRRTFAEPTAEGNRADYAVLEGIIAKGIA
jgi:uncharacterized protein (TIGR03083 family)